MGAWGITVRQSDDGLDLLDTIVAEQLRNVILLFSMCRRPLHF